LIASSVATPSAGQRFVPTGGHTLRARCLQAGSVAVFPSQAANPGEAKAFFDVRVTLLALRDGSDAVAVQMHVRQTVASLVTESRIVNAATWETGSLMNVSASDLPRVRDEIQWMTQEFLADWKSAH
jgi:hypothetical protein